MANHKDNIPDILISDDSKKYHLVKLPSNDARALILGDITGCCQSFDGHSHMCVEDGITRENNGFYIFLKQTTKTFDPRNIDWKNLELSAKIISQSYVWISKDNNFTLDSLEFCKGKESKNIPIKELLEKLSYQLLENHKYDIERVTLGIGGGTKEVIEIDEYKETIFPEKIKKGHEYGDSLKQIEIAISSQLSKVRADFKELSSISLEIVRSRHFKLAKDLYLKLDYYCTEDWVEEFLSHNALKCYEKGYLTPQDFFELDTKVFNDLTRAEAFYLL